MAYLSNYLSSRGGTSGSRYSGASYALPRKYSPYEVPRRGVNPIEQQQSPYAGQDLNSALLMQKQISQQSRPSNQFGSTYDYDPILSKIQALSGQSVANAKTNAGQLRREAVIASGAVPVAKELGFQDADISAAQQNPESELAALQREFEARKAQLIEALNSQNLMYSGEYVQSLADLGQGRASAEGQIGSRLRELLGGIDAGVLDSEEAARQAELEAQQEEALRRQFMTQPVYDPVTGQYTYPTGWDHGAASGVGGGGTPTWVDENGNFRSDPIPAGYMPSGQGGNYNGQIIPSYAPYTPTYAPSGDTSATVPPFSAPPDPLTLLLGGSDLINRYRG